MIFVLPVAAAAEDAVYGYATSSGGSSSDDYGTATLAQLPALLQNKAPKSPKSTQTLPTPDRGEQADVVVLAPALMLSWHSVELPDGIGSGSPRLRAVLEGLLDERLLNDTAELHLALAPVPLSEAAASRRVWVCVCDASWLAGHLKALESLGIGVARVVPEFSPHDGPLQLSVVSAAAPQIVATGEGVRGVARLPLNRAALGWVTAGGATPAPVIQAEPALAEAVRQALGCEVVEQPAHQRWRQAVQASSWNLAQWGLASTRQTRLFKRLSRTAVQWLTAPQWRLARWGVSAFLLVNLAGLNLLALQKQAAIKAQRTALNNLLLQTFAKVPVVVDAPLQMEREMAALRQTSGVASAQDIESILALFGQFAPSGTIPDGIDYANRTARVKGLRLDSQKTADLLAQLRGHGYNARVQDDTIVVQQVDQGGSAQ